MKQSSWIVLGICILLAAFLGLYYIETQPSPATLTQDQATRMLHRMQEAVAHKDVNTIMGYISPSPDARLANLNQDQLRVTLARAFRDSDRLRADVSNVNLQGGTGEATVDFNLVVTHQMPEGIGRDYTGHITLHLQRMEVPRMMGIFHAQEWRIVGAETTGPDPSSFGE